jgi:hypothetical protein
MKYVVCFEIIFIVMCIPVSQIRTPWLIWLKQCNPKLTIEYDVWEIQSNYRRKVGSKCLCNQELYNSPQIILKQSQTGTHMNGMDDSVL